MTIYTYPVHGFGTLPNPDSVMDHDNTEDAIASFYDDVSVTCEHLGIDTPNDLPDEDDLINAIATGVGMAYGLGGWLHVIGVEH